GVDGAIHRAAGPELVQECRKLGGCATGLAKITKGYRLPAKWVIHTVGPVWHDGMRQEALDLEDCYKNSLALAAKHGVRSIAFPCISTGAYGFPPEQAAAIAVRSVKEGLSKHPAFEKVIFCCFLDRDIKLYQRLLSI